MLAWSIPRGRPPAWWGLRYLTDVLALDRDRALPVVDIDDKLPGAMLSRA